MATQSQYGTQQTFERGMKAEDKFERTLRTRFPGKRVIRANGYEEKVEHWDYKLCRDAGCDSKTAIKYEVKGMRQLEMSGKFSGVQDKLFPVEFLTVNNDGSGRPGGPGWAQGKADWIVFEISEGWLLVKPSDLLNMAITKIQAKAAELGVEVKTLDEILAAPKLRANRSSDAIYKVYGRQGRGDALTWVKKEDIMALPHQIWREGEVSTVEKLPKPITVRVAPKRGLMGSGGKQLWDTIVTISSKPAFTLPGVKLDQAIVDQILKATVPQANWNADELERQMKTNPAFKPKPPAGGFREWVLWCDLFTRI